MAGMGAAGSDGLAMAVVSMEIATARFMTRPGAIEPFERSYLRLCLGARVHGEEAIQALQNSRGYRCSVHYSTLINLSALRCLSILVFLAQEVVNQSFSRASERMKRNFVRRFGEAN
jgi:hypothetical protein